MQAQVAPYVNPSIEFLKAFGEGAKFFIYLLHRDYDPDTGEPVRFRPRKRYGTVYELANWLVDYVPKLNSEANKFEVYYAVNDPGQGDHLYPGDIKELRAIYQDCDDVEQASIEQVIAGQEAHAVVLTSPGKYQRLWFTHPLNIFKAESIHSFMAARHAHDRSTKGPARLMRLPGFRNWKYPDGPRSELVTLRPLPVLTEQAIHDHFGFRQVEGNLARAANAMQSSGDMPPTAVSGIARMPAKVSPIRDADHERQARQRDAVGATTGQVPLSDILNAVALLDPDCPRNDWWLTLASLHYMGGGEPWAHDVALAWSKLAPKRFSLQVFEREWKGFDRRDSARVVCWETLQRRTRLLRHDSNTRLRRAEFLPLEVSHGLTVPVVHHEYAYPVLVSTASGDGNLWRPDPSARRNYEYLLEIEGLTPIHDVFASTDVLQQPDGTCVPFDRDALVRLFDRAHTTGLRASKQAIVDHVEAMAIGQTRDPVRDYLDKLPAWDGVSRLHSAPTRYLAAEDTPSNKLFLELLLRACIRRTRKPGAKFDLMWILEGPQGIQKSTFFRELLPDSDWFSDTLRINDEPKRLYQQIGGKLIVEFAELAGMSKADTNGVKKLITQQIDEYIPNYGVKPIRAPRRCVFVGTVNGKSYLRDTTGNRRFPIVECKSRLNIEALKADRDQLWAEALWLTDALYGDNDPIDLPAEQQKEMEVIQSKRMDINTESQTIIEELSTFEHGYLTNETLWSRIGIKRSERAKRTGPAQYMIKEIRETLEANGWRWDVPTKVHGKTQRVIIKRREHERGLPPEIIASGAELTYIDGTSGNEAAMPTAEEMLS
jgi:hypothetical protein